MSTNVKEDPAEVGGCNELSDDKGSVPAESGTNASDINAEQKRHPLDNEDEGISLLREIFPDASNEELEEIHFSRIYSGKSSAKSIDERVAGKGNNAASSLQSSQNGISSVFSSKLTSPLGLRILKNYRKQEGDQMMCRTMPEGNGDEQSHKYDRKDDSAAPPKNATEEVNVTIPDDFLRIPQHLALRLKNRKSGCLEWKVVSDLQRNILRQHSNHDSMLGMHKNIDKPIEISAVFSRDHYVGLGMQVQERNGCVWVQALICHNGTRISSEETYAALLYQSNAVDEMGPAFKAGIKPGDRILGVNEIPFLQWELAKTFPFDANQSHQRESQYFYSSSEILASVADAIKNTEDPIVLHIRRSSKASVDEDEHLSNLPSEISHHQKEESDSGGFSVAPNGGESGKRKENKENYDNNKNSIHPLIKSLAERGLIKSEVEKRALTKEFKQFCDRAHEWEMTSHVKLKSNIHSSHYQYPSEKKKYLEEQYSWVDLTAVRKALCVRIVNTFIDNDRLAYTIWVYDAESQMEWYAPVRYFEDFKDLRFATMRLSSYIGHLSFPKSSWFSGISSADAFESNKSKDTRCKQLESFLRELCCVIYKDLTHAYIGEIAVYLQTFLGCDNNNGVIQTLQPQIATSKNLYSNLISSDNKSPKIVARKRLKQSIQLYTYRAFLLPTLDDLVTRFISETKSNEMSFEEREFMGQRNVNALKERILESLARIKQFLAQVRNLIFDGGKIDFDSIVAGKEFQELLPLTTGSNFEVFKDALYREAISEQVEVEVYVPLRTTISRQIVHGWRHDDIEIQFKIQVLKNKPQSFFKIGETHQSPSEWKSVSKIITEGVCFNTLPCNKLRAIVDAAKEIGRLHEEESNGQVCRNPSSVERAKIEESSLGADDFLPIFIFCVVRAEIERPCSLCILLLNLCDPSTEIGEIGYYLASFEAAIIHIREMDLSHIK